MLSLGSVKLCAGTCCFCGLHSIGIGPWASPFITPVRWPSIVFGTVCGESVLLAMSSGKNPVGTGRGLAGAGLEPVSQV